MDLALLLPDWLIWLAAGAAGAVALATLTGVLEAAFDLDIR